MVLRINGHYDIILTGIVRDRLYKNDIADRHFDNLFLIKITERERIRMRNFKKILASATAITLLSSAFAGMAVNAATGDVLMSQNFDEGTDWGEPNRAKASTAYIGVDTLLETETANMPETVTGNVMHFATNEGENVNPYITMNPTLSSTADVYGVSFDMYLRNASRIAGVSSNNANFNYIVGFGSASGDAGKETHLNMFAFSVSAGEVSYISNGAVIDTGIDTGDDGVWVTAKLKCDTVNKKINGTLTTQDGTVYTIETTDFADTSASTISHLNVKSIRYDGSTKGHVDNYLDNFVVTETTPDTYADVVINYVDGDGNSIKDSITDRGIVGNAYNVPAMYLETFEAENSTQYYSYVSGAEEITVAESGNEITLTFELLDKINYSVFATNDNDETIKTIKTGYVIPGEKVTAYGEYAFVKDGVAYTAVNGTYASYIPEEGAGNLALLYKEVESKNVAYNFEDDATAFVGNSEAATVAIVDVTDTVVNADVNGEKALKFTATNASNSAVRTASLNVGAYAANHKTVVVNYDAYITNDGRMTLNLLDSAVSGYSDTGLFSIGVKDSGGFRVNGTQANGVSAWVHVSAKADFENAKLYYAVTDTITNNIIVSSSKDITAETLQTITFISWSDASAYIDNVEVIATDAIIPDYAYDFEDGVSVFTDNDHAVTETVDATDAVVNADVNGTSALKFTSDAETGESKQAVSTIKLDTLGAEKISISYDSYVASGNNAVFGVASGSVAKWNNANVPFTAGFRTSKNYYVVNGESGSAYTAAAGQWVTTSIDFDATTGSLKYSIATVDGVTTYTSGTIKTELTNIDRIIAASWGSSSTAYIDNIKVYVTYPDTVDFDTEEDVSLFVTNEHVATSVNEDGNLVFASDERTSESVPATVTYDISALTEGKNNIVIKYKSHVSTGSRTVIGVDDIFSQGYGKESYYIINGATGSAYTGAADTWVDTTLDIDLNAGTCVWTVGFEVSTDDGEGNLVTEYKTASKTTYIKADSVNAITITSTAANNIAMIDDIQVAAFGTYVESDPWVMYEATYDENGVLVDIYMEEVEDPSAVTLGENTETTKYFLWKGMTPYVAETTE